MSRKLATIRTIDSITPIPDADAIECLHIGGWTVVGKKNEFKVGEKCVYFEIDSWVPNKIAPFLSKLAKPREYQGILGERLRTVKLRGQLSQGLALPLANFEDYFLSDELEDGYDVSDLLDVKLYEPPISAQLAGQVKGSFPSFITKTDQERIQNLKKYFEMYPELEFEITEKLDGSSCTIYKNELEFGVCSRNLDLKEDENNSFWKIAKFYELKEILEHLNLDIAIQGELIGEGIQGNKYKLKGQDLRVFDIYDISKKRYMTSDERLEVLDKINVIMNSEAVLLNREYIRELKHVPLLGTLKLKDFTMESLLLFAEDISKLFNTNREGIVCKSKELVNGQTISFKAISNKFLLKNEG